LAAVIRDAGIVCPAVRYDEITLTPLPTLRLSAGRALTGLSAVSPTRRHDPAAADAVAGVAAVATMAAVTATASTMNMRASRAARLTPTP
jgi:hypothetical protein